MDWENGLKAEGAALTGHHTLPFKAIRSDRREYDQVRLLATKGYYRLEIADEDPMLAGIDYEIDKIAEREHEELSGLEVPKTPELEPTFSELPGECVRWWKVQDGLKARLLHEPPCLVVCSRPFCAGPHYAGERDHCTVVSSMACRG
jgi:hypothetical protein